MNGALLDRSLGSAEANEPPGQARWGLRAIDGPLTRDMLLSPGGFGLGRVPEKSKPDATMTSVCGYCSTGCSLNLHLKDGEAVSLSPNTNSPVNLGMACPKGWEALTVLDAPDRATTPLLRDAGGKLRPVDWDTALKSFVARMQGVQARHGDDSVAFISTGQMPTEEMAFLGALAKFGMGIKHGDGNTRQCMATSVVAYKQAFGFDAPPYTYADFEESDTIVLIGSNLCLAHPIMWERVMRNKHQPEIIVVDPRRTETAMAATLHLPLKPKSDMELLYGVARILIERDAAHRSQVRQNVGDEAADGPRSGERGYERGYEREWIDREFIDAHTNGFAEFAEFVASFTIERVVAATGLSAETIERFATLIHEGQRVSFWWTMGVNQSHQGVRTAQAIINLALMTGNIGKPGTGANSITGQCNAMGSRLFSNTTNLLGGHDFGNADHRAKVSRILGIDESLIPREASWAYHEILEGVLKGKIHGLWIICTNPAHSWINQRLCHDILDRLEFLVVQDMYHTTETAQRAHLVLPAAGWGEKDGTFINSERRIGVIKKVRRAPGQALSDFAIFRLIAEAWGCGKLFAKWDSPAAVFQILKQLSAGQPCDFTGIEDYRMLDECGGIQWPLPISGKVVSDSEPSEKGSRRSANGHRPSAGQERRLFEDGQFYHADGRAKFLFEAPKPMPEAISAKYPLILLTGRGTASQWHTQTRTGKSDVLKKLYPQSLYLEINPDDARALHIRPNDPVSIESQRSQITAIAFVTPSIPVGQVFLPMHDSTANQLTDAVFDPYSKQPNYKSCAVRVVRLHS